MTLDEEIARMFTCATAEPCRWEEACFHVVKWARDIRKRELAAEALARMDAQEEAQAVVNHYAPSWEASCGLPAIDWDAA